TATIGRVACAGGNEIVLSGDGLDTCTLATAQRVGPFGLSAGTVIHFSRGRLQRLEMPPTSEPLSISRIDLPPGAVVGLCDQSWDVEWLSVPEYSYVTIAGIKLTGRINFDCGRFEYGPCSKHLRSATDSYHMARRYRPTICSGPRPADPTSDRGL